MKAKKILLGLLTVAMLSAWTIISANAMIGDVNSNGRIDAMDYMLVKRYVLRTVSLNDEQIAAADVDGNGKVQAMDYMLIKRHVLGKFEIVQPEEPHVHSFGEWATIKEATCTENGVQERVCACGEKETQKLDMLAHTEVIDQAVAPTCTATGLTEGKHCSVCNTIIIKQTAIAVVDHNFQGGVCTICKSNNTFTKQAEIDAENERHEAKLAQIEEYYPSVISGLQERIHNLKDAYGITYVYGDSYCYDKISSLTTEISNLERKIAVLSGSTNSSDIAEHRRYEAQLTQKQNEQDMYYKCITINGLNDEITYTRASYSDAISDENALHRANLEAIENKYFCASNGHTIVIDEAIKPTCTVNGRTKGSHCSTCNAVFGATQTISATGHSYGEWKTVLNPTCEDMGQKERICSTCNIKEQNNLSALGHEWSEWEEFEKPDCTNTGKNIRVCSRCSGKDYQTISAKGHQLGDWETILQPSCITEGRRKRRCNNCTYKEEQSVSVVNHDYSTEIKETEPTCVEFGIIVYQCKWCTMTNSAQLPPVGHSFVNDICSTCDQRVPTEGLSYDAGWGEENLGTVTGIGTSTDAVITISDTTPNSGRYYENVLYHYPVVQIANNAFENCTNIIEIYIPKTITKIGSYAFSGCTNLKTIVIPEGVTHIGAYAFYGCSSLEEIVLPSCITSIEEYTFAACVSLKRITIGDNVVSIEKAAFGGCVSLMDITIGKNLQSIGASAFYNTAYYNDESKWNNDVLYIEEYLIRAKTTIAGACDIKEGTKIIASEAFKYCYDLTSVTIANTVVYIGEMAFYQCLGLTNITIPANVCFIGRSAFSDCINLTQATFKATGSWRVCTSLTSTTETSISNSMLANSTYAAKYLNRTYCFYYWKRG